MKKSDIIESIVSILGVVTSPILEDLVNQLKSPEVDIIVWKNVNEPITEHGFYLMSDGNFTDKFYFDSVYWKNSKKEFDWADINSHFYPSKIIKYAKMPEYKTY